MRAVIVLVDRSGHQHEEVLPANDDRATQVFVARPGSINGTDQQGQTRGKGQARASRARVPCARPVIVLVDRSRHQHEEVLPPNDDRETQLFVARPGSINGTDQQGQSRRARARGSDRRPARAGGRARAAGPTWRP